MPRIAIVTGAGSGIGRAVATALHADGWTLVLAGRRAEALAETAAGCTGAAPVRAIPTDVTDAEAVDALFAQAVTAFGRIDLLFNNAGAMAPAVPFDELPVATLRAVIEVNLIGSMLCARAAMGVMKRQRPPGGRIINNGSISAHSPRPHGTAYTASKHAITGLTKSIALDGRAAGIAAGQIDIGNAVTEMSAGMATGMLQPDGRMAAEARFDVAHVARAVVHMASLPAEANIPFLTIMATTMPHFGRG